MTDFNFLRIKWPKLAAIAADADRLVEVSPSSAISTMQNFCEWATDIVLDLYGIDTQNGITQQEKLETLRTTGDVPPEILACFNNILVAGGRRVYRVNEDVEEARRCIEDVYDIGRWLNKEADRVGWPPRGNSYRPVMSSSLGGYASDGGRGGGLGSRAAGGGLRPYLPIIGLGAAGVLIVVLVVIGIHAAVMAARGNKNVDNVISATPSSAMLVTMPTDTPTPTATPEVLVYLDTLQPVSTPDGFNLKQWTFNDKTYKFAIADKEYDHGLGMYISSKAIKQTQASVSMKFKLDGKYSRLRFDMGADANLDYGKDHGKYQIRVYTDDDAAPVYDSKKQNYDFTALGQDVDIKNCKELKITLTEVKGSKGTINVVLGDIRLLQGKASPQSSASTQESATPQDNASPQDNETPKTENSATPTPKATSSKKATTKPSASAKASSSKKTSGSSATAVNSDGDDGEQQPPP